jgi:hypothetical protein
MEVEMKALLIVLALAFAAAACSSSGSTHSAASPTASTSTSAPATTTTSATQAAYGVLQRYVDAFNRGDIAGAVAEFDEHAVFISNLGGCTPCVGREVIRSVLSRAAAAQTHIAIAAPRGSGDTVMVDSTLTSPQFPAGVTRAIGTDTATVHSGLIMNAKQDFDTSDPQTKRLLAAVGAG